MSRSTSSFSLFGMLLVAAALVAAGWLAAEGLRGFRTADRHVTVKGLAERVMPADLGIWTINYKVQAHSLPEVQNKLSNNQAIIRKFFERAGFDAAEITMSVPQIQDQYQYDDNPSPTKERYAAESAITVRSTKVDAMRQAMQEVSDLLSQGVMLTYNYEGGAEFKYTKLNDIKPALIAEATANARAAAEQFANDSGASVGSIREANQGVISIDSLDPSSPHIKKVRVVTTVAYFLND